MFLLREVRQEDLDELDQLARHLNTVNLPANRDKLRHLIEISEQSFGGEIVEYKEREYIFVLIDLAASRLVGTCMIIAQHGTHKRPAVYFNVGQEQKYSDTLDKYFVHQTLQLKFNYDGATEIGGLILDPEYQGHPQKLGKLLSFVRFLYMGAHRELFRPSIIAELLPQLNPNGTSDLWDALGAQFTQLDYMTADKLSRENVEFVRSLFPHTPIYTALLPEHVRTKIGKVGDPTKPVERMLKSIGFDYDNSIDPFDGGPTFRVQTDLCPLITRTHQSMYLGELSADRAAEGKALVSFESSTQSERFRAFLADYQSTLNGFLLRSPVLEALSLNKDTICHILPLNGQDFEPLY